LLDGITSVTPRLAYLGYRAWITKRSYEARQPDAWKAFKEFAARQEAALAIGLTSLDSSGNGVIGLLGAQRVAHSRAHLEPLAQQLATDLYGVGL
jgi:hypothetical protein